MTIPDKLLCLFTAEVEEHRGGYAIKIPTNELALGDVEEDEVYRVALIDSSSPEMATEDTQTAASQAEPPVEPGDVREVEIEDIGQQGDGIARIEQGYIVFVEETDIGDRVTVEIADVRETFAFGEVTDGPY